MRREPATQKPRERPRPPDDRRDPAGFTTPGADQRTDTRALESGAMESPGFRRCGEACGRGGGRGRPDCGPHLTSPFASSRVRRAWRPRLFPSRGLCVPRDPLPERQAWGQREQSLQSADRRRFR